MSQQMMRHVSRIAKVEYYQAGLNAILLARARIERIDLCWRRGSGPMIHVAADVVAVEIDCVVRLLPLRPTVR